MSAEALFEAIRLATIGQLYADPNLAHRHLHTVQEEGPELIDVEGSIDLTALVAALVLELNGEGQPRKNGDERAGLVGRSSVESPPSPHTGTTT